LSFLDVLLDLLCIQTHCDPSFKGKSKVFEFYFVFVVAVLSVIFLILSCIEVGSNDAANLVNAVFGAGVLPRKKAVFWAGIFVILGAVYSSPVLDTVRNGIFDIAFFDIKGALSIFISAYLVNTLLLYIYSGYGLSVSTTATLVFSLAGAAIGVSETVSAVRAQSMLNIILAIFISVAMSASIAFCIHKLFRFFLPKSSCKDKIQQHGPWITATIISGIFWFMLSRPLKEYFLSTFANSIKIEYLLVITLLCLWLTVSLLVWILLKIFQEKVSNYLFHFTAILGMCCMAFAFGQNDLANCASPGIAILLIVKEGVQQAGHMHVPIWSLALCGFLIFLGMRTKRSQRVTRAEISIASQQCNIQPYAPYWCRKLATFLLNLFENKTLPPTEQEKINKIHTTNSKQDNHYDTLRASVILSVSGCVIAVASDLGFPISTTYVSFASVIATGWADSVFDHEESNFKIGRAIWVVTSWFMGAFLAMFASALSAWIIYRFEISGIVLMLAANWYLRTFSKKRSDIHESCEYAVDNSISSLKVS
jgi:phosphate/sulfate permease